jgi:heat shock protein HtpX
LFATLLLVLIVIAVTATATFCGSLLFVVAMVGLAYFAGASKHNDLISRAQKVTAEQTPELAAITEDAAARLRPGPVQTFIVPSNSLNAYTFGLSSPKVVVIYSSLLRVMNATEVKFVLGHELGHVRLGHTWLNSLAGGMAGIPSPFGARGDRSATGVPVVEPRLRVLGRSGRAAGVWQPELGGLGAD